MYVVLKVQTFIWPGGSVGWSAALSRRRSRVRVSSGSLCGILAQLGEHLPYKQMVIGSSPIGSIDADVAQLAEQLICNQQVIGSSPIIGFSRYKNYIEIWADSRVAKGDRL